MYIGKEISSLSGSDLNEYGPELVMTNFNANSVWIDYVRSKVGTDYRLDWPYLIVDGAAWDVSGDKVDWNYTEPVNIIINNNAFDDIINHSGITTYINVPQYIDFRNEERWGSHKGKYPYTQVQQLGVINPNSNKYIEYSNSTRDAFQGLLTMCPGFEMIKIHSNLVTIKEIGTSAFCNLKNFTGFKRMGQFNTLTIERVGARAFYGCSKLDLNLPLYDDNGNKISNANNQCNFVIKKADAQAFAYTNMDYAYPSQGLRFDFASSDDYGPGIFEGTKTSSISFLNSTRTPISIL